MVRESIVALGLLLSASVAGADEVTTAHVTTYGTATLQVAPNQMRWRLNIRNENAMSTVAAEEHGTMVASVMAFLKRTQVPEETIQTSDMRLGEIWSTSRGPRERIGYFASTEVSFTLVDFTRYSSLWIGLSGLPGVTVSEVVMDHTDRIRFQNEARTKAVLAARDKARGIAEALGAQLGEPLTVDEDLSVSEGWRSQGPTLSNIMISEGEPAAVDEYLAPGSIPIRVRVKAVFRLLTQP